MVNTSVIFMALSLLINNVTFLHKVALMDDGHYSTQIVFILSICLLLYNIPMLPNHLWGKNTTFCFLIETAASLAILECSLVHMWKYLEDYILSHADDLLVQLSDTPDLYWVVCQYCDGKSECSEAFAYLLLKMLSFGLLMILCLSVNAR